VTPPASQKSRNGVCVVRVGNHYRAIGLSEGNVIAWFWIGTHEEYNRSNSERACPAFGVAAYEALG